MWVQVKNELRFAVDVQYRGDRHLESCGVAEPGQSFSLPLNAVYGLSSDLFFMPCGDRSVPATLDFFIFFFLPFSD